MDHELMAVLGHNRDHVFRVDHVLGHFFWEVFFVYIGGRNLFFFTEIATFKLSDRNPN